MASTRKQGRAAPRAAAKKAAKVAAKKSGKPAARPAANKRPKVTGRSTPKQAARRTAKAPARALATATKPSRAKPAKAPRPSPKEASARARGVTVDAYQNAQPTPQREVIAALRDLVKQTVPGVIESIKWGQPVYECGGPMVFLRASKAHVTFGFWRGAELEAEGFTGLQGDGTRMRHLKLSRPDDLDRAQVAAMIDRAARLNAAKGDPTRR